MAPLILVFTVFTTYICFANGQSQCLNPNGAAGVCISIYECPPMLELIRKQTQTEEEKNFIKNSQCGWDPQTGKIPTVCCPFPCYTPEGQPGKCVGINSCPHIAGLLKRPISEENMLYVQSSICKGSEQYSVCCGPPPDTNPVPIGNCAATMNGLPPNPKTECCGIESKFDNRIVGGNETTVDQYPWLAIIEYLVGNQIKLWCGGALISSRYVLTAAHCVAGDILNTAKPTNVRLAEYDTSNEGKDCALTEGGGIDCTDGIVIIPIERTITHPGYNTRKRQSPHDIALIRMTQSAPFTDFIRPICLPTIDLTLKPPANFTMFASGWGAVSLNESSSNIKLFVDLPFVSTDKCKPAYSVAGRNVKLTDGQICAGGQPGKDSCKGDSGGPLVYQIDDKPFDVIGIVSFGPTPCGLPNVPGIYTKVYQYNSWIRGNMKP